MPVLAWPMTSVPERATGSVISWMGNGVDDADGLEGLGGLGKDPEVSESRSQDACLFCETRREASAGGRTRAGGRSYRPWHWPRRVARDHCRRSSARAAERAPLCRRTCAYAPRGGRSGRSRSGHRPGILHSCVRAHRTHAEVLGGRNITVPRNRAYVLGRIRSARCRSSPWLTRALPTGRSGGLLCASWRRLTDATEAADAAHRNRRPGLGHGLRRPAVPRRGRGSARRARVRRAGGLRAARGGRQARADAGGQGGAGEDGVRRVPPLRAAAGPARRRSTRSRPRRWSRSPRRSTSFHRQTAPVGLAGGPGQGVRRRLDRQ